MLTPKEVAQLNDNKYDLETIEKEIDTSIIDFHGFYPWEYASITYELPMNIRDKIAKKYIDAGWNYVYHVTTSEKNERSGLTAFMFSMEKLADKYTKYYHVVSKDN